MTTFQRESRMVTPTSDEPEPGERSELRMTFRGRFLNDILAAAIAAKVSPPEFVRESLRNWIMLRSKQREGYRIVIQDSSGHTHYVLPA